MRSLHVLVVGINYAPEHTGIAPYTTAAAEHWAKKHDVTVLTGVPHYPGWQVPAEYRHGFAWLEERNGVRVTRLRHFVPSRQSALLRGAYELSFGVNVLVHRKVFRRPDVVIGVVPSLAGSAAAARIARSYGARFGLWVQDLMGQAAEQSGISGGDRAARTVRRLEGGLLRSADLVGIISGAFEPYVMALGVRSGRLHLLRNWSHIAESHADPGVVRHRMGWDDDQVIALHTGNMGLKQGLENVVAAARYADEHQLPLRFVLIGDGSQRGYLETAASGVDSLEIRSPVTDTEYSDVLAAADVLLLNERVGVREMSLPSKLTSYFASGRPVVAAVAGDGGTAAEIRRSGAGVLVDPARPDLMVDAVGALAADATEARRRGDSGRQYVRANLGEANGLAALDEYLAALSSAGDPSGQPYPEVDRLRRLDAHSPEASR